MEESRRLYLHIYSLPEADTVSHLYSDAGDGYGPSRLDTFHLTCDEAHLKLDWDHTGAYPFAYDSVEIVLHATAPRSAWADGAEVHLVGNRILCDRFASLLVEFHP